MSSQLSPNELLNSTDSLNVDTLLQLSLFQGESPEALVWLLDCVSQLQLEKDQVLLERNSSNSELFIVLEGSVRVELEGDEAIRFLGQGECVGELSVLDEQTTSARVLADEQCRLLVVPRDVLWQQMNKSNVVSRNLLFILSGRVRRGNSNLSESIRRQRMCEHHATVDCLTGLYNRRWLDKMSQRIYERNVPSGEHPLAIMLLDVDHFKKYNDAYGHQAGDEALRVVSAILQDNLRASDSAARYGGEEFLIILPDVAGEDAHDCAERIRQAIQNEQITNFENGETPTSVTVSIGVSIRNPGEPWEQQLERADKALYAAKHNGRNRIEVG